MDERYLHLIPHNCALQIQALYESLKSAERKAADFILAAPDKVSGLKVIELSKQAGCSEATIVRLSRKLGYEGFPELKRDFALHLHNTAAVEEKNHEPSKDISVVENGTHYYKNTSSYGMPDYFEYEHVEENDTSDQVLRKVFEASIQAIHDTLDMLAPKEFSKAAKLLADADNLMFCGLGDAAVVAMEAYQRFIRIGKNCFFSLDADTQLILATQLKPNDVIIGVSHTGKSRTVIEALKTAKTGGAHTIGITNFPISPLAKHADTVLQTAVFSKTLSGEVMSKRITALCIIEALYLDFLIRQRQTRIPVLEVSNEIVHINKM